jgi:hypothetical protein
MIGSRAMRLVLVLVIVAGCGPIVYVNEVTRRASDKVEEARAAEADKYAPYYWTRAKEYYRKAREVAAYADFQGANAYGRLASEAAEKAIEEAALVKKDPSKGPVDTKPKPLTAPAKDGSEIAPAKETP